MTEHDLEEFAGYLRGMKERTGRSYEALAKRAGISSSAIHRYCSGKGLPADFGTVERIAKVCGAHSDELLELHRRWIRAEAAQAWAKAEGAPTVPKDAGGTEPPPGPSDEGDPAVSGGESRPASGGRDRGVSGDGPPGDDAPVPASLPGGPERRPDRPSRTRRRLAVAAVVMGCSVAAAAGTAAIMSMTAAAPVSSQVASASPEDGRLLLSRACPPVMGLGEHDECVRELQRLLLKTGGLVQIDADFGPGTLRHVVALQVLAGLAPNGLVDDTTKRVLYQGTVKMLRWPPRKVESRIREVFPEEPDRAVGIAKCMSFLDQYYSLPNVNGTRNWGVFQISDRRLAELGGTPLRAFDPEWNIQAARRLWSQNRDFSHWENCDQTYRQSDPSPSPGKKAKPSPGPGKGSKPSPEPGRDGSGR